jgi:hypothetical protein
VRIFWTKIDLGQIINLWSKEIISCYFEVFTFSGKQWHSTCEAFLNPKMSISEERLVAECLVNFQRVDVSRFVFVDIYCQMLTGNQLVLLRGCVQS